MNTPEDNQIEKTSRYSADSSFALYEEMQEMNDALDSILKKAKIKRQNRKSESERAETFSTDPELALYEEVQEINESMSLLASALPLLGKDGVTPIKGEDYFTEGEIASIIQSILRRIKVRDGNDGTNGKTPKAGIDYPSLTQFAKIIKSEIENTVAKLPPPKEVAAPVKGKDYFTDEEIEGIANYAASKRPSNAVGSFFGGGQGFITYKNNGTKVSDHVTDINYASGLTATYAGNGQINVTSVGFSDHKVRVSGIETDSESDYLFNKLVSSGNVVFTKLFDDNGITFRETIEANVNSLNLATKVTGTLAVTNGGTGDTTGGGMVPVGGVVAWMKSFTGTPAIPVNWVEANGQVLSDAASVYNGATIPNLNGASAGTKRFLRGSTTSGTTGGADTYTPAGTIGVPSATSSFQTGLSTGASGTHTHIFTGTSASYLPSYYEVVYIMRIK